MNIGLDRWLRVPSRGARGHAPRAAARGASDRPGGVFAGLLPSGFGWSRREQFYRHLSVQVANGISMTLAVEVYHKRMVRQGQRGAARAVWAVLQGLRDGRRFAVALRPWLPSDEAMMIASGEQSGNLPMVLEAITNARAKVGRVKRVALSVVYAPVIYLIALYALVLAVGIYIVPTFDALLPRDRITGMGAYLYMLSAAAASPFAAVPVVLLAATVGLGVWALPRWTGRTRVLAERVFPFSFYRDINGYLWVLAFASMLAAGQSDVKIFAEQARRGSPWMRERMRAIGSRMENGASLADALRRSRFDFPSPDMIDDIESMSGFTDFPRLVIRLADQWVNELEWRTANRAKMLGLVFEVLVYGAIGVVLLGINSITGQLGAAAPV